MKNPNKTIISRRTRPAKGPLSTEIIIMTALQLLNKEGFKGLSMRKVAVALDTGPASLYVYVENLNELSSFVLDRGLAHVSLPNQEDGDWKNRLYKLLESYLFVLYRSPGLAELAQTITPKGPHSLLITETIIGLLDEVGLDPKETAWAAELILLYATSVAFKQSYHDYDDKKQFKWGLDVMLNGMIQIPQSLS
ncbi:Tetracycline repressor protein class G [compost metagenome]